jgi:hypothetical protein
VCVPAAYSSSPSFVPRAHGLDREPRHPHQLHARLFLFRKDETREETVRGYRTRRGPRISGTGTAPLLVLRLASWPFLHDKTRLPLLLPVPCSQLIYAFPHPLPRSRRCSLALHCSARRRVPRSVLFSARSPTPPLLASSRSFPPCPREEGTARAPAAARPPAIQRTRGQSRASKRPHALRLFRF